MSPVKTKTVNVASPVISELSTSATSLASDASPSNPDVLRTLYSVLLKTRLLEEQVLSLLRAGKIPGTLAPALGGEATEVGACVGLLPGDSFSSSKPKLVTDVVRGTPLPSVFAQLFHRDDQPAAKPTESMQVVPPCRNAACELRPASLVGLIAFALWQDRHVMLSWARKTAWAFGSRSTRYAAQEVGLRKSCSKSENVSFKPNFTRLKVLINQLPAGTWQLPQEGRTPTLLLLCRERLKYGSSACRTMTWHCVQNASLESESW